MKRFLLLGLVLVSCGTQTTPVVLKPTSVVLPERVGASQPLTFHFQVLQGCASYKGVTVLERTPTRLNLQIDGLESVPCPSVPNVSSREISYTDAGSPARVGPFEVLFSGELRGTVEVVTPPPPTPAP